MLLRLQALILSLAVVLPAAASNPEAVACRWWQFGPCDELSNVSDEEGLPPDAPREGVVVTIDISTNTAYLYRDGALVGKSRAASGKDGVLKQGTKVWLFRTPRGRHSVVRKVKDPIWTKPDWAFVEEGKKVPSQTSPLRLEKGKLGRYALHLGDGIMIHGTDDPKSIGRRASHGCIRLPAKMLEKVWQAAAVGTQVWIFDSVAPAKPEPWREQLAQAMAPR